MGANTEYIKLETIEKTEWDRIREGGGGGDSSGVIFVPFTVTETGASTTADFSEVLAAVQAGKYVVAKVVSGGMTVCGGLTYIYPDVDPEVLAFCVVAENSKPDEQPKPGIFKIAWSASGINATIINLAVSE